MQFISAWCEKILDGIPFNVVFYKDHSLYLTVTRNIWFQIDALISLGDMIMNIYVIKIGKLC